MIARSQLRLNEIVNRRRSRLGQIIRDVGRLKEGGQEEVLEDTNTQVNRKDSRTGLDEAEEKSSKIVEPTSNDQQRSNTDIEKIDLDDVDIETIEELEKKGYKVIYPNLKYRKPKYHNVSEMLKYVESDAAKGEGVKLVIMNFND